VIVLGIDPGTASLGYGIVERTGSRLRALDFGVFHTGAELPLPERLLAIHAFLLDLEARERARTGIPNLRVQFNKVHGFYIEVTQSQAGKVPADYQRRQTLKNAERYITPELKAFEDKALSAQERSLAREKMLYERVLDELQAHIAALSALARALAAHNPERCVWASNWPHPGRNPPPDNVDILDLLLDWVPGEATRERILVENPAQLYGF